MDISINTLSILSENCLLRVIADFNTEMKLRSAIFSLGKALNKKIVNREDKNSIQNISSIFIAEDGAYKFESLFIPYGEFRLLVINLLKWIEENGKTTDRNNFTIDLKLIDKKEGPFKGTMFFKGNSIENINKLKFILSFNEGKVFSSFPETVDNLKAQSIKAIEPASKFSTDYIINNDPVQYKIFNTVRSGITFEHLSDGFLRMQYIKGSSYQTKVNKILQIIELFCFTAYECVIDKSYTEEELKTFKKLIEKYKKIQKSYKNYDVFKQEYPNIEFTVNLFDNEKILSQFYDILKDKIYDIISNVTFKSSDKWKLNYDSAAQVLQIKDAIFSCKNINNIEFIDCELKNGHFSFCDFYLSKVSNSRILNCNIYRETVIKDSILSDSFSNRTTEIINSEISGLNSVTNSKVKGGLIRHTKMGKFAEISSDTKVLKYEELKTGFIVAGDKVITKNPNKVKVN